MDIAKDRESHAAELGRAIDNLGDVVDRLMVESNNLEKILLGRYSEGYCRRG